SHDPSAFAAHANAYWWRHEGSTRYPHSGQLLILSDTGGSNGARRRTWKTELQSQVADSLGLTLTVAHYPTGASKWNPIEHRLFPKSPRTGRANHSIVIRKSSTSFAPPERKLAWQSPPTSTVATISPALDPRPNS